MCHWLPPAFNSALLHNEAKFGPSAFPVWQAEPRVCCDCFLLQKHVLVEVLLSCLWRLVVTHKCSLLTGGFQHTFLIVFTSTQQMVQALYPLRAAPHSAAPRRPRHLCAVRTSLSSQPHHPRQYGSPGFCFISLTWRWPTRSPNPPSVLLTLFSPIFFTIWFQ